ncbi:peptidylprolyl isomerase [Salinibacter ruber]|uniref:Peptidyl-prolyl cis-trans isomerase SurA n=1 Tax=Salinibacter ruber TaxID=146919 RepID=A0A9X2U2R4_9BACT|nr:peptidylprolyl isomerase [Salinibacter ruber]MCS3858986.1 peptidyl-prolyl cis-trans isomerase SurA [Salinibacter ruber]MCS3865937.1 peptidyl-prolyl cis-trans isomerase SurA [Salinibacter ruber]MCS4151914.1 peptidyl-prolyl cis-trans isomerase SurA [Salinibacter ruber]
MIRLGRTVGAFFLAVLGMACSSGPEATEVPSSAPPPDDAIVARYADTTLTLAELDSAFVDAAGGPQAAADSSLRAYRDFLDRYLHFRLKVRAARDAGLDTLPRIRREVHDYRQERARPQLLRTEVYAPLARTLYERRTQAVDVSHILIRPASSSDTLAAYREAQAIADSVGRGVPFGDLALRNSDAPAARTEGRRGYRGRLGYLQAGDIVEPFEDRMYAVPPGGTSDIFRTKFGYHILKVHDRRPAAQPVELAHILRRPQGDSATSRRLLDSLRTEIRDGPLSFAAAAREYSQDRQSASKGGALGEVTPRALPPPLRKTVAALDSAGAVSGIVQTRFGYHLLKLIDRSERPSFDEAYSELKDRLVGQPRAEERTAAFARTLRAEVGAAADTARLLTIARAGSVDSLARPLLTHADTLSGAARPAATLGDSVYTVDQMARHLMQTDGGAQTTVAELMESFLNEKALQYAATRRAQTDPALRREVQEYRNGTLLFHYMQDSVWTAAARDTAGLRKTYRQNRTQYQFPERVRTLVLRTPADSVLRPYATRYERDSSITAVLDAAATDSLVSTDTVYVTDRSADVYRSARAAADGEAVGPLPHGEEWLFLIRDARLPPRPMRFEEARRRVVQDHQDRLERRVLRRLRERYDAEAFPERLRPPVSDAPTAP